MFKFIDKQIEKINDEKQPLSEKLTSFEKAQQKMLKIKDVLLSPSDDLDNVTIDNIDSQIDDITNALETLSTDDMRIEDLKKFMQLGKQIELCKKFISDENMVNIFVVDKNNSSTEITNKIKDGLFIEQIVPKEQNAEIATKK